MSQKNQTDLTNELNLNITDPTNRQNTAARVRQIIQDVIDSMLNSVQGGTVSGNTSFPTLTAATFYSGNTPLQTIIQSLITGADTYTTGVTFNGTTAFFDRTDQLSAYTLDLSTLNYTSANLWSASTGINSIIANNGTGNKASGQQSIAIGSGNTASNSRTAAIGGQANIAAGLNSAVLGGHTNSSNGGFSVVLGGRNNLSSGNNNSAVLAGSGNTASGQQTVVIGGLGISGSADNSVYIPNARLAEMAGTKIYSAGTALELIFAAVGSGDVTRVQPGTNITTGGTGNLPTVSVVASPSFTNVSATTFYSAGTNLETIINSLSGTSSNLWSASTGLNSIIQNNSTGNLASGANAIAAGSGNTASGTNSVAFGGTGNTSSTTNTFVGGGKQNASQATESIIIGGSGNTIFSSAFRSGIVAGQHNQITSAQSFIGGGKLNKAQGAQSAIVGGSSNLADNIAVVIGGSSNSAMTDSSVIVGGQGNLNEGYWGVIAGGSTNIINSSSNTSAFIGGGDGNTVSAGAGVILGGFYGAVNGKYSSILSCFGATNAGQYSTILGGQNINISSSRCAFSVGGYLNVVTANGSGVIGGSGMTASVANSVYIPNARLAEMAGTKIYSAGTDLYNIFAPQGGTTTFVQPGTNTYTGGTSNLPTVNISAATLDHLTVSGNSILSLVTATTLSILNSGATTAIFQDYSANIINTGVTVSSIIGGSGNTISSGLRNTHLIGCVNVIATSADTTYTKSLNVTGALLSGGTNLSAIFAPISVTGGTSGGNVINGLNTYTGGSSSLTSVNISAATLDHLTVTGLTTLSTFSVTNLTASTIAILNSGTTNVDFTDWDSNIVKSGNTNSNIFGGSGNTINNNLRNIGVMGVGLIATTNDTNYMSNLVVTGTTNGKIYATNYYSGGTDLSSFFLNVNSLSAGTNVTLTPVGNTITINSTATGGGSGFSGITAGTGVNSTITVGAANTAGGFRAIAIGGSSNNSATQLSAIIGGATNSITTGTYGFIGGGIQGKITGTYCAIVGGAKNHAYAHVSGIFAGQNNTISTAGMKGFIGGGYTNSVNNVYGAVIGGTNNASASKGFVGGGHHNSAGSSATIIGGQYNTASGTYSSCVGGNSLKATGTQSFIGGGASHSANTTNSAVVGGNKNAALGECSTIIGGTGNTVSSLGINSVILGGASIIGTAKDTAYVPNLVVTNQKQIFIATGGTNPSAGLATLVGGTVTVNTTKATAAALIFITAQDNIGTPGFISITTRVAGTSFTITSSNVLDTSDVAWLIIEPSLI